MRGLTGWVLAVVLMASTGCGTTYGRRVHADLLDSFPVSFAWGFGLGASLTLTPMAQAGISVWPTRAKRYGYQDRIYYGYWREAQMGLPWTPWVGHWWGIPDDRGDRPWWARSLTLHYRWSETRFGSDAEGRFSWQFPPSKQSWGRYPPLARASYGALGIPADRRRVVYEPIRAEGEGRPLAAFLPPEGPTVWQATHLGERLPRAWDLFEADIFLLFIGLRVGVRPVEFADFATGLVGFDLLGDDVPSPETFPIGGPP